MTHVRQDLKFAGRLLDDGGRIEASAAGVPDSGARYSVHGRTWCFDSV